MDSELRELQELYIKESNAFLECLRQRVSLNILDRKRKKIKEISSLIDKRTREKSDPSSTNKRTG